MASIPFDDHDGGEELSQSLQLAVDTIRRDPVPPAALDRSLGRAMSLADTRDSTGVQQRERPAARATFKRSPWRSRRVALVAAIFLVTALAPVLWWTSKPATSWAQVVAAVKERPWIHVTFDGGFRKGDLWIDPSRQRFAARRDDGLEFDDQGAALHEFYDLKRGVILRTPIEGETLKMELRSTRTTIVDLLTAVPDVGDWVFLAGKVTGRSQKPVEQDGHKWLDFTLQLAFEGMATEVVVRVDPERKLPAQLTMQDEVRDGAHDSVITYRFDYPADGPVDIYALGAPKAAEVIDCRPTDEVAKIRAATRTAKQNFGDYVAHIAQRTEWEPHQKIVRIWRQGARFRVEAARPDPADKRMNFPERPADEAEWVRRVDRELKFTPIQLCDGKAFYQRSPDGKPPLDKWYPLLMVAPEQAIERFLFEPDVFEWPHVYLFPERSYLREAKPADFEPNPSDGPAGTVRLTSHLNETYDVANVSTSVHWLDPQRGFACRRWQRSDPTSDKDHPSARTCEFDKFRQNPRGVWYPTFVRYHGCVLDEQGKELVGVSRIHVDFARPIPADAFKLSTEPITE